jgi:hypothetical protein
MKGHCGAAVNAGLKKWGPGRQPYHYRRHFNRKQPRQPSSLSFNITYSFNTFAFKSNDHPELSHYHASSILLSRSALTVPPMFTPH